MQTFLPYRSYTKTAQCLDRMRLGKQRVEGLQILKVLLGHTKAWQHHPAVLMWRGHERELRTYVLVMCREWRQRGYQDTVAAQVRALRLPAASQARPPRHFTNKFIRSHRSNLIRKMPEHYQPQFPRVPATLPYVWPVRIAQLRRSHH